MRRCALWWIVFFWVVAASGARAAGRALALEWTGAAPEGCPGEAALRSAVGAALGREAFVAESAWRVEVAWGREGEAVTATIRLWGPEGERGARRLVAAAGECAALHRSVASMVALAIDPLRAPVMPAAVVVAPAEAPSSGAAGPEAQVYAGVAGAGGVVPGPALSARLGGGLRWPGASVGFEGRWWAAPERAFAGGRFRVRAVDVAAEGCLRAGGWSAGCLTVAVGQVSASGAGYGGGGEVEAMSLVLGGRGRARVLRLGPVEASVVVDAGVSLAGVRLEVAGATAWETPIVVLGGGVEVAVDVF